MRILLLALFVFQLLGCDEKQIQKVQNFDVLIRNGSIIDGSGQPAYLSDIAINGENIVAIGKFEKATAKIEIDASGLVVAPGFINMLSWAVDSLIEDGNSQSDIRQGVTLKYLVKAGLMVLLMMFHEMK